MDAPRIAFLGLGTMGAAMAARLADAGFPLTVWNRTRARAEPLAARGARLAATPAEAARDAAVAITMLSGPRAVLDLTLGEGGDGDGGVLGALARGSLLVDMSTCDPATERQIAAAAAARGVRFVDAPVYGSRKPAEEGSLVVLAGGEAADVADLAPVFAVIARKVVHAGPAGCGAALKVAVNATGAHVLAGVATGFALATAAGVDGATFLDALDSGAFGSPLARLKGPLLLARHYPAAFRLDLMRKDVDLAARLAEELGVASATLNAILGIADEAIARRLGEEDLAAIYEVVRSTLAEEPPAGQGD